MIVRVKNYLVEIENNSVLVLPTTVRCRVKEPQTATFAEVHTLQPSYVKDAVWLRVRHTGIIYLIHFDQPYKHARHYLGFTKNLDKRLLRHTAGKGSRLMQVVEEAGITWQLARVWYGDRYEERRLKKHSSTRYCPICNPNARKVLNNAT